MNNFKKTRNNNKNIDKQFTINKKSVIDKQSKNNNVKNNNIKKNNTKKNNIKKNDIQNNIDNIEYTEYRKINKDTDKKYTDKKELNKKDFKEKNIENYKKGVINRVINRFINKNVFFKIFFVIFNIIFITVILILIFIFLLYKYYFNKLPNIDEILDSSSNKINILYDDATNKIRTYSDGKIDYIDYDEIPQDLINALIATEDRAFFEHGGIDYVGILRAFIVNFRSGYIKQGGSTITQQLSKMILNDHSKTYKRKFKELVLAKKLEKNLSKENILTLYLSRAYFGAGTYGIKEASKFYFNKELDELNLEECAMLVGLLKAPSKYSPINDENLAKNRANQVILNMQDAGFINKADIINYIIPDLNFYDQNKNRINQSYYFSDWVYNKLPEYGLYYSNMSVITTLNYLIQDIVVEEIEKLNLNKNEVAVIVMNKEGEILSMVGGKNYNSSQFNRAVHAKRQTGSLFKLFIYLTAFEKGLKISDIFVDEPIKVANWYPENHNLKYLGNISVVDAFAYSSNSVAVQIADIFGIKDIIKTAKKLGIVEKFKKDLTITLGSQESTLLDMVAAYTSVINGGHVVNPRFINYVLVDNEVVYSSKNKKTESLFNKNTIDNMKYLLFNVIDKGTGKRARIQELIDKTHSYNYSHVDTKFFIGGKTGTTQNYKDAWFIGFANDFVIGIWMGNDDNTPMKNISGGGLPAILWHNIALNFVY